MIDEPGLSRQVESFREVRENLEASVLPLATSVDGRRFSFQASLQGLEFAVADDRAPQDADQCVGD